VVTLPAWATSNPSMGASSPGSVSLGRFDHATPELALMWEVVGHRIVERVVVLPDNDGIRSPGKAKWNSGLWA